MSLEAFISGRSVVTSSGAFAAPSTPLSTGSSSGTGTRRASSVGVDGEDKNIVLAERTSQLMSSYRDYISGQEDEEMMMSGNNGTGMRDRSNQFGGGGGGGGGAPLLREWNHGGVGGCSVGGGGDVEIEELWDNYGDEYDDSCGKRKKGYRYHHPIFHSRKFKRSLLAVAVAAALIGTISTIAKSGKDSKLPDWDEELKEVLVEEGKGGENEGGEDESRPPDLEKDAIVIATPQAEEQSAETKTATAVSTSSAIAASISALSGEVEAVTRHVLCCSSSPDADAEEDAGDALRTYGANRDSQDQNRIAAAEYARAESRHPIWYDRSTGWNGSTYAEAVDFCSKTGENAGLCPYDVYCPTGPHHIPLGGYRGGTVGAARDGDGSKSSRSPVGDYPNGWVQVGTENVCVQYTILDDGTVTDSELAMKKEAAMDIIMDEIMQSKQGAGDDVSDEKGDEEEDQNEESAQGEEKEKEANEVVGNGEDVAAPSSTLNEDMVVETYVPVNPGPSSVTEDLVANREETNDQQQQEEESVEASAAAAATAPEEQQQATATEVDASQQEQQQQQQEDQQLEEQQEQEQHVEEEEQQQEEEEQQQEQEQQVQDEEPQGQEQPVPEQTEQAVPAPPVASPSSTAAATPQFDIANVLHQKFKPLWLSRKEGWLGGSHSDAIAFCASIRGKKLCPYSAMCPHGAGKDVMGGRRTLTFNVEGVQYAPVLGEQNHWVMIGTGEEGDGSKRCKTHRQLEGRAPEWGLNGDNAEMKMHVMCCTVV